MRTAYFTLAAAGALAATTTTAVNVDAEPYLEAYLETDLAAEPYLEADKGPKKKNKGIRNLTDTSYDGETI